MFSREHRYGSAAELSRQHGATTAHFIAPLAVIALVAITAWLEFDARAAARSAVRDYAQAAASRYSQHITTLLRSHLAASTTPVRDLRASPDDSLPHPRVLFERAWQCNCGAIGNAQFTFRYDFTTSQLVPDRELVAPVLRSLARHVPQALPQITENANTTANGTDEVLRKTAMIVFDTVASQPFVISYALVADATNRPRALYGVATDASDFRGAYEKLAGTDSLLLPSVTKGRPNDSLMVIRATDATTAAIFERLAPLPSGAVVHVDTLDAWLGAQVVTVALRPGFVEELRTGGAAVAPRPLQLALLGLAAVVSLLTLKFRRRRTY